MPPASRRRGAKLDMSLKTEIWVKAYVRLCHARGLHGAVVRHGADAAGAVYVVVNRLDGTARLFGPAPGPAYADTGERRWSEETRGASGSDAVSAILKRRLGADPDLWIVEIEDRSGTGGLETVKPDS